MSKKIKFEFGTDFQELILQYTVTDKVNGKKALKLYDDSYFTLLHHAIIAFCLKKFFKKKSRIPSETVLRETLRVFYMGDKLSQNLNDDDKALIDKTITHIYSKNVPDGDVIMEKCRNFARFVAFKKEMENIDINNYDAYSAAAERLKKAQNIGSEDEENWGTFVVSGMQDRAHNRDKELSVFPTPYWQFNKLLNGGGTTKGNVVMLMSQAKRFKTGAMINLAIGYMRLRKKVLYIDFENGEDALTTRAEQSVLEVEQDSIIDGIEDKRLLKLFRKYRRVGAELVIKRFSSYRTTTTDIQVFVDEVKEKFGITFQVAFFDYGDLMGATTGQTDETNRINDAFVDLKNFADHNNLEACYTASHVKREAAKRRKTKYEQNDVAKCIDKVRHVDCIVGLQENDEEIESGVQRWEIVDQRNGMQYGNMLFWVDIAKQKLKEFTRGEVKKYREALGEDEDGGRKKAKKESDL